MSKVHSGRPTRNYDRDALLEAIEGIHSIYTPYPRLDRIKRGIGDLVKRSNRASQGDIHVLVGPTRSGKSHFLDDLTREYPPEKDAIELGDGDFCDRVPVVVARLPKNNEKTVLEYIYHAISGLEARVVLGSKCTADMILKQIIKLARECGLKLLILDEAHQSIDNKTDKVTAELSVMLKDLVNYKIFSILVVGTRDALKLVRAKEETQARVKVIYNLEPFGRSAGDRQVWDEILSDIDLEFASNVFGQPTGIIAPDMAEALHNAARGVIGHMADLLEQAAIKAVDEMIEGKRSRGITWSHLEETFAEWGPGVDRVNPFSRDARPPVGGTAPEDDALAELERAQELEEGPMSGVRGTKRTNHRDAQFRR